MKVYQVIEICNSKKDLEIAVYLNQCDAEKHIEDIKNNLKKYYDAVNNYNHDKKKKYQKILDGLGCYSYNTNITSYSFEKVKVKEKYE